MRVYTFSAVLTLLVCGLFGATFEIACSVALIVASICYASSKED